VKGLTKVVIVDYGVGNLHSIARGMELAGAQPEITPELERIEAADGVILPGVGAFKSAMEKLSPRAGVIKRSVSAGKPLLGICLGMQLSMSWSEEGGGEMGLGVIPGKVLKLPPTCKVPQMGWNSLTIEREHPFLEGVKSDSYVYFVHSYFTEPEDERTVLATTEYGVRFPAVIAQGLVIGTQFHPEKSGKVGLRMLRNFVRLMRR
jgi:glutamine amidotransferase